MEQRDVQSGGQEGRAELEPENSPCPPWPLERGEPSRVGGCTGPLGQAPTITLSPPLADCRSLVQQLACVIKAPELETPPSHSLSHPLLLKTVILQADNEARTTIQKNAWLWRLRACPNCTCRFSLPEADGHWLRCTCRRPAPCLSATYLSRRQALACSTSCSARDGIFCPPLTSQQARGARLWLLPPPFDFL